MRLRHSKYLKGQVLLETAIVFISLAVITIASTRLFSNLNLDMLTRLDRYKEDRLNAVNGAPLNPSDYLYQSPNDFEIIPGGGTGGIFNPLFYTDPRVEEAGLLLEAANDFAWVDIPYKINQAYYLAGQLYWAEEYYDEEKGMSVSEHWERPEYVPTIQGLMGSSLTLANTAYNNYGLAIDLLEQVLDAPIDEGPFDPEPADPKQQEYNLQNRSSLTQTIESLKTAQEGLNQLLNEELIPRLQDVQENIGYVADWPSLNRFYLHNQAVDELAEMVDFIGIIDPSILKDKGSDAIVTWIDEQKSLLAKHHLNYEDILQAKEFSAKISSSEQVGEAEDVAEALDKYLDLVIKYWDKEDTLQFYSDLTKLKSIVLYEVTEVNRLLEEFKPKNDKKIK